MYKVHVIQHWVDPAGRFDMGDGPGSLAYSVTPGQTSLGEVARSQAHLTCSLSPVQLGLFLFSISPVNGRC